MKIINIDNINELELAGNRVVALGLFESMHRGHYKLIDDAVNTAIDNQMISTVVTVSKPVNKLGKPIFDQYHRIERMAELHVDEVIMIGMSDQVRTTNPAQFIDLLKRINTKIVVSGSDYRFGHLGAGDVNLLKSYFDLRVEQFELADDQKISTTRIKEYLSNGKIAHANSLLGYNYYIKGTVEQGKQLGRTIGVPTANVYPEISPLATGVYLTETIVFDNHYRSITNIGYNPTTGDDRLSIETYIGDGFDSNIYGQEIKVEMIEKIREEIKFSSLDALVEQMQLDIKYMEEANYENC